MLPRSLGALVGALLALPAAAQTQLASPLQVTGTDDALGTVTVAADPAAVALLAGEREVRLVDVYLPGGELVDLELYRLDLSRLRLGFQVDGRPAGDLTAGLELSIWRGHVPGRPGSQAYLTFSNRGCHGWIQTAERVTHLMGRPDANGDWTHADALLVDEDTLNGLGDSLGGFCSYDRLSPMGGETQVPTPSSQEPSTQPLGSCLTRECTMAIETDFQLYQKFNDLGALTTYVTSLLAAGSDRYYEQIDTVLTYPYVRFYTTSNDPWTSGDNGGSSIDMLIEFENAWTNQVPFGAKLGHFLSGASLGGGVAYLSVICGNQSNFGVSGNISGSTSFPITVGPSNWDFIVFTHETGHNFGTPHTHDYCPPIDQCAPSGYFGNCQTSQVCTNQGTIMSYCHLCSGGTSNVTTYFHPTVVTTMSNGAQNCLPLYSGVTAHPPTTLSSTQPTPITADILGAIASPPIVWYRYTGGAYTSIQMQNVGGTTWSADLPPAGCDATPQFYLFVDHLTCGSFNIPAGAPSQGTFTAQVGTPTDVLADDFEADNGWTTANLGASSGDWERGVPVNDAGWAYDPIADYDGSGSCWLTQNAAGNTDVDNGAVELTSPAMDLSGGDIEISYAYYLRLTDSNGADRLLVEVSTNGAAGPWTQVALHTTDGGTSWRTNTVTQANLTTAGVVPSANTMVRFTVNDANTQSVVEAGVDAFVARKTTCDAGGPTAYCAPPNANSVSSAGLVLTHVSGAPGGLLTVRVDNAPLQPGVLFFGTTQIDLPFGCGRRCAGGTVIRTAIVQPVANTDQFTIDTAGIATTPFNLQYWYRDPANLGACGNSFNLSNALGY